MSKIGNTYVQVLADMTKFTAEVRAKTSNIPDVEIDVDANTKLADAKIKKTSHNADEAGNSFSTLSKRVIAANQGLNLTGKAVSLIKWPAMISGASYAVEGLNALTAGALALTGALTPLAGALGAAPALYASFGQAAGVVALAGVNDLTDALGGNEEALKRLTPEARKFMEQLQGFQPEVDALKESVQSNLFGGAGTGVAAAAKNFDSLQKVMAGTAKEMGRLAANAGKFLGSDAFGRDFEKIGATNAKLLGNMGDAGINLASALRHVMVAARPLVRWLGRTAVHLSEIVEDSARAGRKSGDLQKFFAETKDLLKVLGPMLGDFGKGLWNILRLGKPLGDDILGALADSAEEFRKWTESASGKNAIVEWFDDARRPLEETGKLILDIGEAFFDVGSDSKGNGLTKMIRSLRKDLLPTVVDILKSSRHFGPVFVEFAVEAIKALKPFIGATGVLTVFLELITDILRGVNGLIDAIPQLGTVLAGLVTLRGITGIFGKLGFKGGGIMAGRFGPAFAAGLAVWAIANRDAIIDALIPEGDIRDKLHELLGGEEGGNWWDGTAPGDAFNAWGDSNEGWLKNTDDALKNWTNTATLGLIDVRNEVDVTDEQFRDFRNTIGRATSTTFQMAHGLRITKSPFRTATQSVDFFTESLKKAERQMEKFEEQVKKSNNKVGGSVKDVAKTIDVFADDSGNNFGRVKDKSGKMAGGVARNSDSMVNAVANGLQALGDNVNKALQAFEVKRVAFSVKKVASSIGKILGAQKGAIVPGYGTGDTVPLHINGALAAMVEPGEQVSVLNRKATKRLMDYNKSVPRFAGGGTVTGDTDYLPALGAALQRMSAGTGVPISVTSGGRTMAEQEALYAAYLNGTGNLAAVPNPNAPHVRGIAADISPGRETFGSVAGKYGLGFTVPSESWHIELLGAAGSLGGAVATKAVKIARQLLKGPDGPMKKLGQAALDKAWKGGKALAAASMPTAGPGNLGPGANLKSLPQTLSKYNHIYPPSSGFGDGYALPFDVVAALAEWAGAPGISMAKTAIGESQLEPGAIGHDPGGTTGLGIWMITTGFNDELIARLGGVKAMRNPALNAMAMSEIFASQGIGAWYSQTADASNTHYTGNLLQKGGVLGPAFGGWFGDGGSITASRPTMIGIGDGGRETAVVTKKGSSPIELHIHGKPGTNPLATIDDVYAIVDGERAEVKGFERQIGRQRR